MWHHSSHLKFPNNAILWDIQATGSITWTFVERGLYLTHQLAHSIFAHCCPHVVGCQNKRGVVRAQLNLPDVRVGLQQLAAFLLLELWVAQGPDKAKAMSSSVPPPEWPCVLSGMKGMSDHVASDGIEKLISLLLSLDTSSTSSMLLSHQSAW
jgi:hypothetical protein